MYANVRYCVRRFAEYAALIAAGSIVGVILTVSAVQVLVDAGLVGQRCEASSSSDVKGER